MTLLGLLPADLLASVLGAVVGLILALTGAGGGSLAVPLLVFGLGLGIQQAAPVALVAVGLAAGLGALLGLREGLVRYRAAALMGVAGMLTTPLGVWLAQRLPAPPLLGLMALLLAWSAWRMWQASRGQAQVGGELLGADPRQPCHINPAEGRLTWTLPCARALAGIGLFSGGLSGLLGVGGGFVIVPALTRHTDISPRGIAATSLAVIALVALGGVLAAASQGALHTAVAGPFALGTVLALLAGRRLAQRLPAARLQQAFAAFSALTALALLARALGVWAV